MIIDVHSHTWNFSSDFSEDFIQQAGRARPGVKVDISATYEAYRARAPENTRTIVFGGRKKCQAFCCPARDWKTAEMSRGGEAGGWK